MNEDGGHDLLNGLVVALVDDPDAVLASLVVSLALKQEEARIKWKGSRLGVLRSHVASAINTSLYEQVCKNRLNFKSCVVTSDV